jgi:hypothetical protein
VFWRENENGIVLPLLGLEAAVFDAFGQVWVELVQGYKNMIMIDKNPNRESIECFLHQ